ncbi:unnamed protein product [Peniophora sp. CBMAI 1063]|nr:unnamed protein product [Peniophora sp. CBMAI 1063]
MSEIVDLANLSDDPKIQPYLLGDDDSFVCGLNGEPLRLEEDFSGNECTARLIERGNVVWTQANASEDLSSDGKFLYVVLSTKKNNNTIPVLRLFTSAYIRALADDDTEHVDNKEAIQDFLDGYELEGNAIVLSDIEDDLPTSKIKGVLTEDEFDDNFVFDQRVVLSYRNMNEFNLYLAEVAEGTPEI